MNNRANRLNELGQPIGFALPDWQTPPFPPKEPIVGQWVTLEPADPARHASALFEANALDVENRLWTYLAIGPFANLAEYQSWMRTAADSDNPLFYVICDKEINEPVGVSSYLRITPESGGIEVGNLCFSPKMQKRRTASEAMYLMTRTAFDLGYRRYEWKCDSLNEPSRAAATRLGFQFEGIFQQAIMYKGRNRDTAWFSITNREWEVLSKAYETWLAPENFDPDGRQVQSLSGLTRAARAEIAQAGLREAYLREE